MSDEEYSGGCLCGEVRYQLRGPVKNPCHCHCKSCRRGSGAAFVSWGSVETGSFTLTRGELAIVNSSPQVERGFCGNCGSSLTYAFAGRAGEIDVALASLDDPALITPVAHIFVEDKLPWIEIGDELPSFQTVPS